MSHVFPVFGWIPFGQFSAPRGLARHLERIRGREDHPSDWSLALQPRMIRPEVPPCLGQKKEIKTAIFEEPNNCRIGAVATRWKVYLRATIRFYIVQYLHFSPKFPLNIAVAAAFEYYRTPFGSSTVETSLNRSRTGAGRAS